VQTAVAAGDAAFFEGDFVMYGQRVMSVLGPAPQGDVLCVWYESELRMTGSFTAADLQMLSPSPLRPGYRVVRSAPR
jgi:hypothetical protein